MSTKRTGSPKVSRGATETTTTTVGTGVGQKVGLTAEEERAIRMRFGLAGDDGLALDDKAGGNADVMAKLQEIERRAFEMTGRSPAGNGGTLKKTKSKIVSALRDKSK